MIDWTSQFLTALSGLIGITIGSRLRGYQQKKGENVATHEDIHLLVEQVKAVTQATKEIENKISNETWDRQKRWELKRDLIVASSLRFKACLSALMSVSATQTTKRNTQVQDGVSEINDEAETRRAYLLAESELEASIWSLELVCELEACQQLRHYSARLSEAGRALINGDTSIYEKNILNLSLEMIGVQRTLRGQLLGRAA